MLRSTASNPNRRSRWRWVLVWLAVQALPLSAALTSLESRSSPDLRGMLALYAVLVIGKAALITIFTDRPVPVRTVRQMWIGTGVATIGLLAVWAFPFHSIRYLNVLPASALSGAILALWWGWIGSRQADQPDHAVSPYIGRGTVLIALLMLAGVNLATLMIYPVIHSDEGWLLNTALTSSTEGMTDSSINMGVLGRPAPFDPSIYWPMGTWLHITGVGITQGRLFFWLFWPLTLIALFAAGRNLYSEMTGWAAALIAAASTLVFYVSHNIRAEGGLVGVLAVMLWLHTRQMQRKRFWEAVLIGFLAVWAVEIHQNGVIYPFAFGAHYTAVVALDSIRTRRLKLNRGILGLCVGGVTGVGLLFLFKVAPDVALFSRLAFYRTETVRGVGLGNFNPISWIALAAQRFRGWSFLSFVEAVMALLAVLVALRRSTPADRTILSLLLWTIIGWGLFTSVDVLPYISNLFPFFVLLMAAMATRGLAKTDRGFVFRAAAGTMLIVAMIFGSTAQTLIRSAQEGANAQTLACLQRLSQSLPDDVQIVGDPLYWIARPRLERYVNRWLMEHPAPWISPTVMGMWQWAKPDVILYARPLGQEDYEYATSQQLIRLDRPDLPCVADIWVRPGVTLKSP